MSVYIELVLLENALIDGALLTLALIASHSPVRVGKVIFAAILGAVFAAVFPLFSLPLWLQTALKIAAGFVLVFAAFSGKGVGRYAITALCFFLFSFAFAGAVIGLNAAFFDENSGKFTGYGISVGGVLGGAAVFCLAAAWLFKRLYRRKRVFSFVYPCRVQMGEKTAQALGFLDSGNLAKKNGRPVCFVCPKLLFSLIDESAVCEYTNVGTVSGTGRMPVFKADELQIYFGARAHIIKNVYLSPFSSLAGGDYQLIIGAAALEGEQAL